MALKQYYCVNCGGNICRSTRNGWYHLSGFVKCSGMPTGAEPRDVDPIRENFSVCGNCGMEIYRSTQKNGEVRWFHAKDSLSVCTPYKINYRGDFEVAIPARPAKPSPRTAVVIFTKKKVGRGYVVEEMKIEEVVEQPALFGETKRKFRWEGQ